MNEENILEENNSCLTVERSQRGSDFQCNQETNCDIYKNKIYFITQTQEYG